MIAVVLAAWIYLAMHAAIGEAIATPCAPQCAVTP